MDISTIQSATATSNITTTQRNTKEETAFASILQKNHKVASSSLQEPTIAPLVQSALVNTVELTPSTEHNNSPLDAMEVILEIMQEYISNLSNTQKPTSLHELHSSLKRVE